MSQSTKRLWKNIPTQKHNDSLIQVINNAPIVEQNSIHYSDEICKNNYGYIKKSSDPIEDINQTAKFGVAQFQSLVKSQKFEKMMNQVLQSNDITSQGAYMQKNKVYSLGIGNNLILSISNNSAKNTNKKNTYILEQIQSVKLMHNSLKASILEQNRIINEYISNILQALTSKNSNLQKELYMNRIENLEQQLQKQKQLSKNFKQQSQNIVLQLQKIMNQLGEDQQKKIYLQQQLQKAKDQHNKLQNMIKQLSRQNQQLQQSLFQYQQKSAQFDIEVQNRVKQIVEEQSQLMINSKCFINNHNQQQCNHKILQKQLNLKEEELTKKWKMLEQIQKDLNNKIQKQQKRIFENKRNILNEQQDYYLSTCHKRYVSDQQANLPSKYLNQQLKSLSNNNIANQDNLITNRYFSPKRQICKQNFSNNRYFDNRSPVIPKQQYLSKFMYNSKIQRSPSNKLNFLQEKIQYLKRQIKKQIQQAK